MLQTLTNLLLGQRGLFQRRREGGVAGAMNNKPKTSMLAALATFAAPFLIRKLLEKHAQRRTQGAPA